MLPLICTLRSTLAFVLAAMVLVWILSLLKRDASVVDLFWGAGFVLVAWLACWLNHPVHERAWLMAVLTTVWGLRLSLYLLWRNWGHGEDRRYRAMREQNGPRFWLSSLWRVFLLQGVILWLVSLPLQGMAACNTANSPGVLDGLGTILWGIGLLFEAGGDWQLARFQANPANAGQVMDRGLWRLTRHPNYFGDFCIWWGLFLIAAAGGAWWTVVSPLVMSFFLLKVSGVTLLEKTITERRPAYAAYQARTNAFFPGPLHHT